MCFDVVRLEELGLLLCLCFENLSKLSGTLELAVIGRTGKRPSALGTVKDCAHTARTSFRFAGCGLRQDHQHILES